MNAINLRLITAYLAFAVLVVFITYNTVSIPFSLSNNLPSYITLMHILGMFAGIYILACKLTPFLKLN